MLQSLTRDNTQSPVPPSQSPIGTVHFLRLCNEEAGKQAKVFLFTKQTIKRTLIDCGIHIKKEFNLNIVCHSVYIIVG